MKSVTLESIQYSGIFYGHCLWYIQRFKQLVTSAQSLKSFYILCRRISSPFMKPEGSFSCPYEADSPTLCVTFHMDSFFFTVRSC